jgi:hypothetical protein
MRRTLLLPLLIALIPLLQAYGKEEHEAKPERRAEGRAAGSGGAENQGQEGLVLRIPSEPGQGTTAILRLPPSPDVLR